jgi:GH15 family glucan-1,4-alpha-glucosidase
VRVSRGRRRYHPIGEYAAIGDGLTAALVAKDGSLDWCCFPRFDSPSVFARILDSDGGGHWHIAPRAHFSTSRAYEEDTNVLITVFETESGAIELVDFMPAQSALLERIGDSAIVRIVRGRAGASPARASSRRGSTTRKTPMRGMSGTEPECGPRRMAPR